MRCKNHFSDLSSIVGVCASCLRERLFSLIVAQAQAQAQAQAIEDNHRKSDAHAPPLAFPRSVSPYITRHKSDNNNNNNNNNNHNHHNTHHHHSLSDQRFYSTPQVGPTGGGGFVTDSHSYKKKRSSRFSLFSNMLRFKPRTTDLETDPCGLGSGTATSSSSSPSWFSNVISGRRKKKPSRLFYIDESTVNCRKQCGIVKNRDRGMSPVRYSDDGGEDDYSSACSSEQTPYRAAQPVRRQCAALRNGSVTGFAFCLSPLVRASPSRHWNGPEVAFSGEIRVPVKPHLSNVKSFCANRSRKLADFGRFNPNR